MDNLKKTPLPSHDAVTDGVIRFLDEEGKLLDESHAIDDATLV